MAIDKVKEYFKKYGMEDRISCVRQLKQRNRACNIRIGTIFWICRLGRCM